MLRCAWLYSYALVQNLFHLTKSDLENRAVGFLQMKLVALRHTTSIFGFQSPFGEADPSLHWGVDKPSWHCGGTSLAMFCHLMEVVFGQQVRSWSALQRADLPCSKAISSPCSEKCNNDPHSGRHLYAHTVHMYYFVPCSRNSADDFCFRWGNLGLWMRARNLMSKCFTHFHKPHGSF